MSLPGGTRLGPYQIVSPLGAGGMGEVYKARDTRLDRVVAVKVLPPQLASDPQFRDRFEREARSISQLDHPHICALYDVGEELGTSFLVMQYLEGETLADRLTEGPLPVEEALRYAAQIADALDKAHRAGIVHRDVKPGNIMIVRRGGPSGPPEAKLLDFGLARSGVSALAGSGLSMLPTTPPNLTAAGAILGTFQYMAPEQLEGQDADARTDIFALGAVIYEMLTGRKAFEGRSQATLIAAIVSSEPPPVSGLQSAVPPLLDDVVRTCLAKDPDARWQSAADLLHALALASKHRPVSAGLPSKPGAISARIAWPIAALAILVAIGVTAREFISSSIPPMPVQLSLPHPAGTSSPLSEAAALGPALSPDGRHLVFPARTNDGRQLLWLRHLDSIEAHALPGTEDAMAPFWSPDGRFVAFFSRETLKKIDVTDGASYIIGRAPGGLVRRAGTWSDDGVVLFSVDTGQGLYRISANGGEATSVTTPDRSKNEEGHYRPTFLPGSRNYLYFAPTSSTSDEVGTGAVYTASLDSTARTLLLRTDSEAKYAGGYLFYVNKGSLMARRFEPDRLALSGEPVPVASQALSIFDSGGFAAMSVSTAGTLAYVPAPGITLSQLTWVDRRGQDVGTVGKPDRYRNPQLSPDGRNIAVAITGDDPQRPSGVRQDIWVFAIGANAAARVTTDGGMLPIWSPDAKELAYRNRNQVLRRSVDGRSAIETIAGALDTEDWSRDGRVIIAAGIDPMTNRDLWVLPLNDLTKPIPFARTTFNEIQGQSSRDGRWIAYVSNESGQNNVYVQGFPAGPKSRVSTENGVQPRWRSDGQELFYLRNDGTLMSVTVTASGTQLGFSEPRPLFKTRLNTGAGIGTRADYDVLADGSRFLLNAPTGETNQIPETVVIVNWPALLRN